MRKKRFALLAIVLVVLALAFATRGRRRMSTEDVDALLRATIPADAHHGRVAGVLDSLGVQHSGYREKERRIDAIWRRTAVSLVCETSIQAHFVFGEDSSLALYEVEEVHSCL